MPLTIVGPGDDLCAALRAAVLAVIPDAVVTATGNSPGHFGLDVVAPIFAGKSRLQQQQLVYGAIKQLMAGDHAPVHAIDSLTTRLP